MRINVISKIGRDMILAFLTLFFIPIFLASKDTVAIEVSTLILVILNIDIAYNLALRRVDLFLGKESLASE